MRTRPTHWRRRRWPRRKTGWGYSTGHPMTWRAGIAYIIVFLTLGMIGLALR